jgi:hypothetical protein
MSYLFDYIPIHIFLNCLEIFKKGTWLMKLTFGNLLFSTTSQLSFVKVPNIILRAVPYTDIVQPNTVLRFNFNITSLGQPSCSLVKFLSNSQTEPYNQFTVGTTNTTCNSIFPGVVYNGIYTIDGTSLWYFSTSMSRSGYIKMTANVSNEYGYTMTGTYISVSALQCQRPIIEIQDSSALFYVPINVTRSSLFTLLASIKLSCSLSINNTKLWSVYLVNSSNGMDIRKIDLPSSSFPSNAELVVPANLLNYGLYRFAFKVQMTSLNEDLSAFVSETSAFIQIVPSGLVIQALRGGANQIELVSEQNYLEE